MDREYMLQQIRKRLLILENRYKKSCQGQDDIGNSLRSCTAQAIRTKSKHDIQLLKLLEHLLLRCTFTKIDDEDIIDGFIRLVEPVERHRWRKIS